MAKATLIQRLLNNPSQSYSFPLQKDYHSTKPALLRIATGSDQEDVQGPQQTLNSSLPSSPSSHSLAANRTPSGSDTDDLDSHSDNDEFFTPRSSYYSATSSPNPAVGHLQEDVPQFSTFNLVQPTPPTQQDLAFPSRKSSTSSLGSMSLLDETWSETAESADTRSIFSSSLTTSTRATTPLNSESGHFKKSNASGLLTSITVSSPSSHVSSDRSSKRTPSRKSTYTDEDWAREVRWLVPESSLSVKSTKTRRKKSDAVTLTYPTPLDPPIPTKSGKSRKVKGRMSAVLEVSEDEDAIVATSNVSYARRTSRLQHDQQNLRSRTRSSSSPQGQRSAPSSKSSSPNRKYRTVAMPSPLPVPASSDLPSRGTAPYSSLTLPRASALPPSHSLYSNSARSNVLLAGGANVLDKLKIENSGKVDLTRNGMASTTMATIEVVKGGAETVRGRGISRSFSWKVKSQMKNVKQASYGVQDKSYSPIPSHLLSNIPSPLGLCSRHPPPNYVPSSHVLVQVWAVGLDGRDEVVAMREKPGFIPGRSFVGRVVETGWEINDDIIHKGEWVVGLIDLKKCGALAEFVVVDCHRINRVLPPASRNSGSSPRTTCSLSIEELALLPLCGVFAYRAVKTFEPSATTAATTLPRKPKRVLVLEGHEGTGALAVQMLLWKGWNVVVQISPDAIASAGKSPKTVERRLNSWGVEEVCLGDPLSVLARMLERHDSEEYVVDGVLDTIGGQDIWLAAQHVLQRVAISRGREHSEFTMPPQFTTLVGDDQARPIPTAQDHFKAGFRSLRRTMTSNCEYTWISVAADIDGDGLDVRHALAGIISWVDDTRGVVRPWVGEESDVDPEKRLMGVNGRVVVFEQTPQLFDGRNRNLSNGGTVVIKVVS